MSEPFHLHALTGLLPVGLRLSPNLDPVGPISCALPVLLLFPLEGIVIAALAPRSSCKRIPFILAWSGLTFVTFMLLMLFLLLAGDFMTEPLRIALGEAAVVVIEALVLQRMLSLKTFADHPDQAPGLAWALFMSLVANLISFVGGVFILTL